MFADMMQIKERRLPDIIWTAKGLPRRPLCAVCCGALPVMPLTAQHPDGRTAAFCDKCCWDLVDNLEQRPLIRRA